VDPLRDTGSTCPECGTPRKLKARASRSFRTLFGTFQFERPRLEHCGCKRRTMTLTALEPYGKGLVRCEAAWGAKIREQIARLPWSLWHGQVDKALGQLDDLASAIAPCHGTYARCTQLGKALSALRTYSGHNRHGIPHDGPRYHDGEAIATGVVASTVHEVVSNRFGQKQPRPWSKPSAHLLLQTRVKTRDGELGAIFKRWYPDRDIEGEERPAAA